MLGTVNPSIATTTTSSLNNTKPRSRSTNTIKTALITGNNKKLGSKSTDHLNKLKQQQQATSIHQFYELNTTKIINSNNKIVLMPKVYQLNFDENFVEKELINRNDRNDGIHSRRGI